MDQPEEILEKLERFNVQKNPEITRELDEYVSFVARTGESVFNWALVKRLYREKLINVITEFYNETPTKVNVAELPQYPNVDPFNYETMKKMLIERLDSFSAAPFTIQRISELLSDPRKQYSRIDKFMRAVEKNILVVSTVSPGRNRSEESENGDSLDSVGLNGDFSSDVNVDIDMENNDGSFTMTKEFNATTHRKESNHDVVTETHETVTIKKVASKEEEASTSAIAVHSNGEELQPTQTDIKIETHSTVLITPSCEEDKPTTQESVEKVDENIEQKTEDTVIKSDVQHEPITLLTENVEPKIDDALLNEPLRPVDDEILPENPETTPLAALENIVATRVEVVVSEPPKIEEAVSQKQDIEEPKIQEDVTPKDDEPIEQQKSEEVTPTENDNMTDDSGIEAKRMKIEEAPEIIPETKALPVEIQAEPIQEIAAEEPSITEETAPVPVEVSVPVVEEPPEEEPAADIQPIVDEPKAQEKITEVQENEEITAPVDTPLIEPIVEVPKEDIPVVEEPVVESVQPEIVPIVEPVVITEEPKETPLENAENTMALDEDLSTAQATTIPQDMPEMEVAPNNKMDTDENETENVLMDTDETEEPMDQ